MWNKSRNWKPRIKFKHGSHNFSRWFIFSCTIYSVFKNKNHKEIVKDKTESNQDSVNVIEGLFSKYSMLSYIYIITYFFFFKHLRKRKSWCCWRNFFGRTKNSRNNCFCQWHRFQNFLLWINVLLWTLSPNIPIFLQKIK